MKNEFLSQNLLYMLLFFFFFFWQSNAMISNWNRWIECVENQRKPKSFTVKPLTLIHWENYIIYFFVQTMRTAYENVIYHFLKIFFWFPTMNLYVTFLSFEFTSRESNKVQCFREFLWSFFVFVACITFLCEVLLRMRNDSDKNQQ